MTKCTLSHYYVALCSYEIRVHMFNMVNLTQKEVSAAYHFIRFFLYWVVSNRPQVLACRGSSHFLLVKKWGYFYIFFSVKRSKPWTVFCSKIRSHPKVNSWTFLKNRISISTFIRSTEITPCFFSSKKRNCFESCWGRAGCSIWINMK